NKRDHVHDWRGQPKGEHRAVAHPGVVTIGGAGLIGHTGKNDQEHRSLQAIVNIVDSSGRPLFFPFKKRWNLRSTLKHLDLLFARRKEGPPAKVALLGSSQVSFYHFVTEVVGDWWFLRQMGYGVRDFDAVVVHGHRSQWQEEILEMLRIPMGKARYHSEMKERHVDLVLPYRTKGDAVNVPAWMCEALWSELGGRVAAHSGTRRIYLSRRDATRRRMLNEADLTGRLTQIGFEVWRLDGMSVAEQQALLASARVVVAEHGAALTNIVWCPKGATVVDIHPSVPAMPCFKILAEQRGLRYVPIFVRRGDRLERNDWKIDEAAITGILEAAGAPVR
ncbi:MAG: glycosyltransferase family 61 protein, partial [Burkholderiales bacterium]|nr:glycosyltransferase family 61 protein [Burkholderiales bacterium]